MALNDCAGWAREATIEEPTWPSVAPARITRLLPNINLDLRTGANRQFTPASDGTQIGYVSSDVTNFTPSFTVNMPMRYGGLEDIIVSAMGMQARWIQSVQMPEVLVAGRAYRHLFELDTNLGTGMPWIQVADGVFSDDVTPMQRKMRRGTLAVVREFTVWEYLSCMIDQIAFGWENTGEGHCNIQGLAYSVRQDPAVNTLASMHKAMINFAPSVFFHQGVLRIKDYSASEPLLVGHKMKTQTWNVTVQNILQVTQGRRTGLSSEEFERGGAPLVLGSFNLPRYVNNIFVDAWPTNTRLMMDLKFTGPLIHGTNIPYQVNFYVPGFYVIQAEPVGPTLARANLPIQWYAAVPPVWPAGFPVGVKKGPLMIELVNHISAHSLLP